jgi:lysyl-tRNA synthetase class 2
MAMKIEQSKSCIPFWRPDRYASKRAFIEARAAIAIAVRHCFAELGFVEVDTPALQISPGLEPHLSPFSTELCGLHPEDRFRFWLHTSPELTMKKLLVAGLPRIFQLAHVFRNGEVSRIHHPEFMMLEWYRAGVGYHDLIKDCQLLLKNVLKALPGRSALEWQGQYADPEAQWQVMTVAEAFASYADIDLLVTAPNPAEPDLYLLEQQSRRIGIVARPGDRWEDLYFRIFLDRIEPKLGIGTPMVLTDYPISMAALARPKPNKPHLAERFEVYVCGLELANAFGELTDPIMQRARFKADQALRHQLYGTEIPIDEDFLTALEYGLPESAGIAMGFDRLVMLATGAKGIEEVLCAPVTNI